ncbi:hypothetical protein BaRGS_00012282, partial [Batillaria attramentaria]
MTQKPTQIANAATTRRWCDNRQNRNHLLSTNTEYRNEIPSTTLAATVKNW